MYKNRSVDTFQDSGFKIQYSSLLLKDKVHRQNQESETDQVVVGERLVLEEDEHEDGEDGQGEEFLDDLELPEVERTAVFDEADAVGRHHETVLDECDAPAEENHQGQRELAEPRRALQLQVTVPRERHEHVRTD